MGFRLILITNQSGVGRGVMKLRTLEKVHSHLRKLLEDHGVSLDAIYVCLHAPWDDCNCRKPKPGLLNKAANDLSVKPESFIMIGDKASDLDSGKEVGAATVLVRTGYGAEVEKKGYSKADFVVDDLQAAARVIENMVAINQNG